MEYISQQADHLRLNLFTGAVPRDQVEILCSGKMKTDFGTIEAHIIGASHFFEWKNLQGEVIFSEVFACQKLSIKESICYASIEKLKQYEKIIAGVQYSFSARKFRWNDKVLENYLCPNHLAQKSFSLQFQFPNPGTKNNREQKIKTHYPAITLLAVHEIKNSLQIDSLHAYPNEKQLVVSQTKLQF